MVKETLTPTHNQHKERDSVWRILGGWWQGGWTAPEFEFEKVTLRVTEISGGLPPCRTGERRIGMRRFTPLPDGGTRNWNEAVYPLPDGGTPGGLPPCWTGERRMQCGGLPPAGRGNAGRFTPLPDGGTPIWNVAVYPPAGRGHADLECGGLPPAGRGHADMDCGGLRRLW